MKKISTILSPWGIYLILIFLLTTSSIFVVIIDGVFADSSTLNHLKETILNDVFLDTFLLVVWVGVVSLVFGVGSAYVVVFYNFTFKKVFEWLLVLPFAIPTYIMGYVYADYFGFLGEFHLFLKSIGIQWYFDFLSFTSLVFIIALSLYPYIYLLTRNAFLKQSSSLINVSKSLGMSGFSILLKIIIPLARPAIVVSLMLVIMETLNEYGAVSYFGVDTFSSAIFNAWFGLDDLASASYLSSITLLLVFIFLIIENISRKNAKYNLDNNDDTILPTKVGKIGNILCISSLFIPVFFGFLFPFYQIIKGSFIYIHLIDEEYLSIIMDSFLYASLFAFIITILALISVYVIRIFPTKKFKFILKVSTLGYAIPGSVISIGVIVLITKIDNVFIAQNIDFYLSGTYLALFLGLFIRFFILGVNNIESGFEKVGIDVNMASRNLGYSYLETFWYIDFPLIKFSFLVSFLLIFVDILKELPLTLILRPFNYETLATKSYYYANNDSLEQAYIYAGSIVLLSLIPMILTIKLTSKKN